MAGRDNTGAEVVGHVGSTSGRCLIALISIALLLWLADVLEARKSHPERKVLAEPPFTSLSVGQAFEPVFAALWEAPIHALELIQSAVMDRALLRMQLG